MVDINRQRYQRGDRSTPVLRPTLYDTVSHPDWLHDQLAFAHPKNVLWSMQQRVGGIAQPITGQLWRRCGRTVADMSRPLTLSNYMYHASAFWRLP